MNKTQNGMLFERMGNIGMNEKVYKFEAVIESVPDKGGAYVRVPFDIKKEFGKGRVKVVATFNDVLYSGSIVNMGVKRHLRKKK